MIIWKGIEFRNKGIIVEKIPKISKGKKRITTYDIPGRNGFLSVDEGTYEPFSMQVECHTKETNNLQEICSYLDGYGNISFDNKKQSTAIINNAIELDKVQMFKKFIVNFLVNPIFEDINVTSYDVINSSQLEISDSYSDIYPTINIQCSGDISITINNNTFYLENTDGEYILDCKNKVITHNGTNASNLMNGDFPTLKNGINEIEYTGTITSFNIYYKKTYLVGV